MIEGGEDPRFIARRIIICAAEDVGNADPTALMLAVTAMQAAEMIGWPEARIPIAQAVTYIAAAPKSNAAYLAIDRAMADVRERECGPVPDAVLLERAERVVVVADSSKIGRVLPGPIAPLSAVHVLVTDDSITTDALDRLTALGVEVVIA